MASGLSEQTLSTFVAGLSEARSQLALPWDRGRLVVVDFETTGLGESDEIISFGAVHIDAGRIVGRSSIYGLVRPVRPVSAESVEVHSIRARDLEGAPSLPEALDPLLAAMVGRVLVAHAAWIETAFLDRALAARGTAVDVPTVDTAELAWGHFGRARDAARAPALEAVAERLGLPVFTPHHALGDAWTTAVVLLALVGHRPQNQPVLLRDLVTERRRARVQGGARWWRVGRRRVH